MAASDIDPRSNRPPQVGLGRLTPAALHERLEEEISRAGRDGTLLSCLLVAIDDLDEIAREHGSALREQTVEYVAGALRRELRPYDRVGRIGSDESGANDELLIILPGADSARGEIVARRTLERLGTIKLETDGTRRPLHVSVGLAAWREDGGADALLARAREAMRSVNGDNGNGLTLGATAAPTHDAPTPESRRAHVESPPTLGRLRGQ